MSTIRDLYLRVSAAVDGLPASIKAEIDTAFADHQAASDTPASTAPAAAAVVEADPAGEHA